MDVIAHVHLSICIDDGTCDAVLRIGQVCRVRSEGHP